MPRIGYPIVDSSGQLVLSQVGVFGDIAHDSPDTTAPVSVGGIAETGSRVAVADEDRVRMQFDPYGQVAVYLGKAQTQNRVNVSSSFNSDGQANTTDGLLVDARNLITGPDAGMDRQRGASDSGPGLGALNVAPIGGDLTLRASAAISEASGAATAVDNLGWAKSFVAHLDVTAVRSGGSNNCHLDVYLQTQLPSGDWQDIVHFTQLDVTIAAEIADWGKGNGNISGIGVEAAAATFDRFFAEHDADNDLVEATVRFMTLGDSMRVKWVYTAGDSDTGDYVFELTVTPHS